jgi:signal transduction histidine kinase
LLLLWVSLVFALIVQGLVPGAPECVYAFAGTVLFVNLFLADLVRRALDLPSRRRIYFITAAVCIVVSFVPLALGARFWMIGLLPSIGVSIPLFDVAREALRSPRPLSPVGRLVIGAVVAYTLHDLDYPFLRNAPWFTPYGVPIAIIAIFALSISAPAIILERTAAEVRRLQAEAIDRERLLALGEAAAVVAHEVRNPLGTMSNTIELLRKESLTVEGRELLGIQRAELLRLDRLVRDLLLFSKPLEPTFTEVQMSDLVRSAMRSLSADAAAASVEFAMEEGAEQLARGDADSIFMAIVNVLRNAIESSPKGGTVHVRMTSRGGELRIAIDDEGSGVPEDAAVHLFKPFFTTRATGSGLGLAILDRIMRAHGGHVRVSNLPSRGARFELVFVATSRASQTRVRALPS